MKDMSQKKWEENWLEVQGPLCQQLDGAEGRGGGSLRENISLSPAAFLLTHSDISEICQIQTGQVWEPKSHLQICTECMFGVSCYSQCWADQWARAGWMRMIKQR